jgi:hypothetical protein
MAAVKAAVLINDGFEKYFDPDGKRDMGLEVVELFSLGRIERHHRIIGIGEEKGGRSFGYATVICNERGGKIRPYKTLAHEEGWINKFAFELNEEFILIRADTQGNLLLQLNIMRRGRRRGEYELYTNNLAPNASLGMLASRQAPDIVRKYALPISACLARLNCEACQHAHYGNIPHSSKR